MLIGGVIGHEVEQHAQLAPVRLLDQTLGISQVAEDRIDVLIVADVVAGICHRRAVDGRQPDGIYAQRLYMIEMAADAFQIAQTIAIAVGERARINLVDAGTLPPGRYNGRLAHDRSSWLTRRWIVMYG